MTQHNKANAIVERPLTYNLYKKLKSPDGGDIFIVALPVVAVPTLPVPVILTLSEPETPAKDWE